MSTRKSSGSRKSLRGRKARTAAATKAAARSGAKAKGKSKGKGKSRSTTLAGKAAKAGKTSKTGKANKTSKSSKSSKAAGAGKDRAGTTAKRRSGTATRAPKQALLIEQESVIVVSDVVKATARRRTSMPLGTREVDVGAALRSVLVHRAPAHGTPVALVREAQADLPFTAERARVADHVASAGSSTPTPTPTAPTARTHAPAHAPAHAHALVSAPGRAPDPAADPADDPAARIPDIDIHELHRLPGSLGETDLHLISEGNHRRLWDVLGSHPTKLAGLEGAVFAVWAPNARRVSVVGDFCHWDGNRFPMRSLGSSGIFELFIPGIRPGDLYKYEVVGADGVLRLKTDPMALKHEQFPGVSAIVQRSDNHAWGDAAWMARRSSRDAAREPMAIYECHLASWARVPEEGNRSLTYREIAPKLAAHCRRLGFTHVELLPVMEHPFGGSWGYQVTGYYAPTSRHGTPDDFRFLVDTLHQAGLGVILDWVPAHFPKDEHALVHFDGTALYEHGDPRMGTHPDWDTLIFNFGRNEVRNFLVANALFWLQEFHADGLRVDAVASMLYLDYSRKQGEWTPNAYGGRENIEAIEFLRSLNAIVAQECPGALMFAEESTSWSGITRPVSDDGGMGFTLKWNLGWMHDTLDYFAHDPIHRRWHQNELTFAMLYERSERFLMPLSHDEVVHGKGSILSRLPGDMWQRLANLRALLAYQITRPGKKLLFMGLEFGQMREWDHDGSLDWHLLDDPARQGLLLYVGDLLHLYREHSPFWRDDHDDAGFQWIDCSDHERSVLAYLRWSELRHMAVVLNLTPVPRDDYRIGVPHAGNYRCVLSSDGSLYGGSNYPTRPVMPAENVPCHGFAQSIVLELPPLAAVILQPDE